MLRISEHPSEVEGARTLVVEGRAVGPWVEELANVARAALARDGHLIVNLEDVSFLDPHAVALLRELEARGCTLVGRSPFIDAQLRAGSQP
ncbi:MAG: hypothetical protein U0610_08375 [bacterium]